MCRCWPDRGGGRCVDGPLPASPRTRDLRLLSHRSRRDRRGPARRGGTVPVECGGKFPTCRKPTASWKPAATFFLLAAAEVFAGARVDLKDIADSDERRHVNLQAGFQNGRFLL